MVDSGVIERKIVLGVDVSVYSEWVFDCKCF